MGLLSLFLSLLSYILPCCGFVKFLCRASAHLKQTSVWVDSLSEEAKGSCTFTDLKSPGEILGDIRNERNDVLFELGCVGVGALCGIASLLMQFFKSEKLEVMTSVLAAIPCFTKEALTATLSMFA